MKQNQSKPIANISLAMIYDLPEKLPRSDEQPFPPDAEAEWENQPTIDKLASTWKELGCRVTLLPLNQNFLSLWAEQSHEFDLVHSVVEGWGSPAREAWIPSLCELSGVPYVGSHPVAQCIAMKKSCLKVLAQALGVPTPQFKLVLSEEDAQQLPDSFLRQPHFIKPDCEGSGMGVDAHHSLGRTPTETRAICKRMLQDFPDGVLVEELVTGRELTSAFVGNQPPRFLPIAEIEVGDGVYGLSNKSKDAMEEKVTFPELDDNVRTTITESMQILIKHIGFEDFVRFDWKLDSRGQPLLLEANPLAGLSYYYSVLPKMAAAAGMPYSELLQKIGESALSRKEHRRFWYGQSRMRLSQSIRPR